VLLLWSGLAKKESLGHDNFSLVINESDPDTS
jgi:hypothetical protein